MLEVHLKPDLDFIVIAVGSNDITKLNTDGDNVAVNCEAIKHTNILISLAKEATVKYDIDVFVLERPARYDKKDKDPKGLKSKLSQVANGMLMPLINVVENVHLVKLPSLDNLPEKERKDIFKNDGIHLTYVGLTELEDDIIAGIKTVYKDIKPKLSKNHSPPQPQYGPGRREEPRGRGGFKPRYSDYYDDRQQQNRGDYRDNQRHWNNRPEPGVQDMVRNFMAFMNTGPPNNGYRGSY